MTTKTVYVIRTYQSVASLRRQIRDPDKPTVTLSEVVGAGTSGPVENAVTDEVGVQQGEVNTHTESSSTTVGEFSPQQYPFSSVAVVVPPLRLSASSPASPHVIQPVTQFAH